MMGSKLHPAAHHPEVSRLEFKPGQAMSPASAWHMLDWLSVSSTLTALSAPHGTKRKQGGAALLLTQHNPQGLFSSAAGRGRICRQIATAPSCEREGLALRPCRPSFIRASHARLWSPGACKALPLRLLRECSITRACQTIFALHPAPIADRAPQRSISRTSAW